MHSTQFEIHEPQHGLLEPVLEFAAQTIDEELEKRPHEFMKITGVCGRTAQAFAEVELARGLGYQAGLLSLAAMKDAGDDELIAHCREVSQAIPIIGFYLKPKIGFSPQFDKCASNRTCVELKLYCQQYVVDVKSPIETIWNGSSFE